MADPRGTVGLLLDANVSDAVDSLLQNNRASLLGEFDTARLRWNGRSARWCWLRRLRPGAVGVARSVCQELEGRRR